MSREGIHADLAELIQLRLRSRELAVPGARRSHEPRGGAVHSPFRGRGMDYAESRPYAAGDDVRHIDWRVSARTGRVHTKLFQAERERVTALVIDAHPNMRFGTRQCFKSVQAARLAALLAWLAHDEGDRLCATVFGDVAELLPPQGGRRGVLHVLEALSRWQLADDPPGTVGTRLSECLESLGRLLRPGSHVLLLLDPRSVDDSIGPLLARLRVHHDLAACLLVDPFEIAVPVAGRYPVTDGRRRQLLRLDEPALRRQWHVHFIDLLGRAQQRLRANGIRVRRVATDEDPVAALRALLRGERQPEVV